MQIGNLVSIIGKLVPNPLSSKSSLQELEQKKEVLKE